MIAVCWPARPEYCNAGENTTDKFAWGGTRDYLWRRATRLKWKYRMQNVNGLKTVYGWHIEYKRRVRLSKE